jgi:glucosamine 6-phosphate synthetase-like amidotransferase/phosphosugar isomerase protein
MCGIFGFVMKKPLAMTQVFHVLQKLEVSQYPGEPRPVGGYGAGVAVLLDDGTILSEKVGKTADSPACQLAEIMKAKLTEASVLIGHVRFPTSEFLGTAKFKETAQPFVEHFETELTIVSAHNGKVENYIALKEKLKGHVFESEKVHLVDSEIIPHYFGEILNEVEDVDEALYELFCSLKGSKNVGNAVAMLHVDEENAFLHLIHKGKTRGLTVWANEKNEVIFSSRPEPVMEEFSRILARDKFKEKASIKWREDAGLKLSFPATFQ